MSGILRLESLTKGNTLKQGDKTPLKYRLFDADGENLNIAGKSAKVRLVYPDFLTIGYEKDGLTVAQDDTVTFTIDKVIPAKLYHVEIIVDGRFIFPSRADESKFTVDKSSLGTESSIIEIVGVDAVVRKAVDLINDDPSLIIDEDKLVTDIISNTGIGNIEIYYQAYSDVIKELSEEKDYHSLPEIAAARGGFDTLGVRLDNTTAQLAQTDREARRLRGLNDFDEETLNFIHDGTGGPINIKSIPKDKSVRPDSLNDDLIYIERSVNIADPNKMELECYYAHGTGERVESASFISTGFIRVEPGETYSKLGTYGDSFTFWKEDFSFLSSIKGLTATAPDGASFLKVNFGMYEKIMVVKSNSQPTGYVPYTYRTQLKADNLSFTSAVKNFQTTDVLFEDNYYINYQTGETIYREGSSFTNMFRVKPNSTFYVEYAGNVVFYDERKKYVSGRAMAYNPPKWYVQVPDNAHFVAFSFSAVNKDIFDVEIYDSPEIYEFQGQRFRLPNEGYGLKRISKGDNLFDENKVNIGSYYDYSSGEVKRNTSVNSSDFIRINSGSRFKKNVRGQVAVFDKGFNFLGGWNMQSTEEEFDVIFPNAYWLSFSFSSKTPFEEIELIFTGGDLDLYQFVEDKIINFPNNREESSNPERVEFGIANSKDFLRVPSPYSDGTTEAWSDYQNTHPSVVQFDTAWNGYRYWMAYTPYPHQNASREDPCVAVSNDGIRWEVPTSITNPLDIKGGGSSYNSDTHIFYREDLDQLEIWYRFVKTGNGGEVIKRVVVSNDLTVGEPEAIIETTATPEDSSILKYISPSVMYEDNKYKLWFMRDWYIHYSESTDLISWTTPIRIKSDGADIWSWHLNIVKRNGVYHLINNYNTTNAGRGGEERYSTSGNGIDFTEEKTILKHRLNKFSLDGRGVYRATPLWFDDGSVGLIYGMVSSKKDWTLGMSVGEDFYNLQGIDRQTLEYANAL